MTADILKFSGGNTHTSGKLPPKIERRGNLECLTCLCEPPPGESIFLMTIALPAQMGLFDKERLTSRLVEVGTVYSKDVAVLIATSHFEGDPNKAVIETTITIPVKRDKAGSCMADCNMVLVEESTISRIEHDTISREDLKEIFPSIADCFA